MHLNDDMPNAVSRWNLAFARDLAVFDAAKRLAGLRRLIAVVAIVFTGVSQSRAQIDPAFQIDLTLSGRAPRPTNGIDAANTIEYRRQALIANLACGQELDFLSRVRSIAGTNKRSTSTGDAVNLSLAKMYWALGLPDAHLTRRLPLSDSVCHQTAFIPKKGPPTAPAVPKSDDSAPPFDPRLENYQEDLDDASAGAVLDDAFFRTFGRECANVVTSVVSGAKGYTLTYDVSPACLIKEYNQALSEVFVTGQMGTGDGMPCHVFGKLHDEDGNWDFAMRSLIRAVYLDRLSDSIGVPTNVHISLLRGDVRDHILHDLIITDIHLGEPDYPITGCGNTENQTGDGRSRVDDGGFFDDVGDALGSFLDWLLKHWYITFPALIPALAAGGADALVLAAVDVGAAVDTAIQATRIPETENHRLMIESTRYLNNQLLKDELSGDQDRLKTLMSAQNDVHDWLLKRLQSILQTDFTEYNARPYQRESIGAIMNLYDFAEDPEMVSAAHLVLEYAVAKFAISSNQGRRLVPFRRHMSDIEKNVEAGDSVLVTYSEADHQEALGLLYLGQTQQLPGFSTNPPPPGRVDGKLAPSVLPGEAAFGAFSWYEPNKLVLDLAIDKSTPYLQRFRHGGLEAYSGGKGYLITAGGVISDYASSVLGIGQADDKGAAVPTTLMFPSGFNKVTMWDFLSFRGIRYKVQGSFPGSDPANSYDHNICLDRGFACGLNSWIPSDIKACLKNGPPDREPFWFFFDSTSCEGYKSGPPVYVVLYVRPCLAAAPGCTDFGFLEAVDQTGPATPDTFAQFQIDVLHRNRADLIATPPAVVVGGGSLPAAVPLTSVYFASDGRKIEFDPTAHILDSNKTGITAINGQSAKDAKDWGTAEGDFMNKNDWPLVTIKNPRFPGQAVTLDFRGWGVAHYDGPK